MVSWGSGRRCGATSTCAQARSAQASSGGAARGARVLTASSLTIFRPIRCAPGKLQITNDSQTVTIALTA